jgi:hypothetical protein
MASFAGSMKSDLSSWRSAGHDVVLLSYYLQSPGSKPLRIVKAKLEFYWGVKSDGVISEIG